MIGQAAHVLRRRLDEGEGRVRLDGHRQVVGFHAALCRARALAESLHRANTGALRVCIQYVAL